MKVVILALLVSSLALPAYAEDWTTTDGVTYKSVKVMKVEDDAVTILCDDGGARVPLTKLPAELQKRFSYDPIKSREAADARAKAEAENNKKLQAEMDAAAQFKLDQEVAVIKKKEELARQAAASGASGPAIVKVTGPSGTVIAPPITPVASGTATTTTTGTP